MMDRRSRSVNRQMLAPTSFPSRTIPCFATFVIAHYVAIGVKYLASLLTFLLAAAADAEAAPTGAQSVPLTSLCTTSDHFTLSDDLNGIWSPCATPRGKVEADVTYLQNASVYGGTALAAYPYLSLRTGIAKNLEVMVQAPSQIAESGPRGLGLYPRTHPGYGLRYTVAQSQRFGLAVVAQSMPPLSPFTPPSQQQPKYLVGATAEYVVNSKWALGLSSTLTSSGVVGAEHLLPTNTAKIAYNMTPRTQISTDLGAQETMYRGQAQSFGAITVNQKLRKNLNFNVALGTAFNPVANTKAHYLSSGFNIGF
jgi:hypothetical protein